MISESLGVFAWIIVLALIGYGPSLWLTAAGERRVVYALGIAPAVGYALIGLLAFPLARYLAPVQSWVAPATAALIVVSLGLAAADWRRNRGDYQVLRAWPRLAAAGAWALGGCLVLLGPVLREGIQYAAFRGNPHDTFLILSISETLRVVEWRTFLDGSIFSAENIENVRRLAAGSPAAPFAAKALLIPLSLNYPAAAGWAAALLGLPAYRIYHVHHLLSFALALPLTLVLGDVLKFRRPVKYLAATAVAFGFWARFVLESDAGYEIFALPVVLLTIFAWMQFEHGPQRLFARSRGLLALGLAATWAGTVPLTVIMVLAFGGYYGLSWLQRARPLSAGLGHGLTAGLVLAIFLFTGQLDHKLQATLRVLRDAGAEAQFPPYVLWLIKGNDVAAVWGLPRALLWEGVASANVHWLLVNLAGGLGAMLTAALALAALYAARRSAPAPERIVFSVLAAAAVLALLSGHARGAGKAFTYVYPYLILGVSIFPNYAGRLFRPPWRWLASLLVTFWLATQFALGPALSYDDRVLGAVGGRSHSEDYDLAPITGYLDAHPPRRLLVTVPRAGIWEADARGPHAPEQWAFAYYAQLAFAAYQPYYQSGLIVDNSYQAQNLWLQELSAPPDYAVILKAVDYIGPAGLGALVAETPELRLYRLTTEDLDVLKQEERRLFQERERETECYDGLCSPPGA